ncbi:MAG: hypothetical protein A3E01_02770 [Gammaproteobacteria bacterium RIFCSPHIGHO2_12_FULL_63_22]|nr:MAG: hypothetical protein A3E01_02770 [Gammaproteobacteria bacterium RIFCSPHIGHO2_12_FULL_63_22]
MKEATIRAFEQIRKSEVTDWHRLIGNAEIKRAKALEAIGLSGFQYCRPDDQMLAAEVDRIEVEYREAIKRADDQFDYSLTPDNTEPVTNREWTLATKVTYCTRCMKIHLSHWPVCLSCGRSDKFKERKL